MLNGGNKSKSKSELENAPVKITPENVSDTPIVLNDSIETEKDVTKENQNDEDPFKISSRDLPAKIVSSLPLDTSSVPDSIDLTAV